LEAHVPTVTLTGITPNSIITGTKPLSVTASCPEGVELQKDIFVDSRKVGSCAGNRYDLDTTTLADGYHEVRVVAYSNNGVRTQGSATCFAYVKNTNANLAVNLPSSVDYRESVSVSAFVGGLANVQGIQIISNGEVLAELPATGGTTSVIAKKLSYKGINKVYAKAILQDGSAVWSMPGTIAVTWSNLTAKTITPSTGLAVAKLWNNAASAGFNWTQPDQTQTVTDRDFLIYQNTDDNSGNVVIDLPMVTAPMLGKAAMEFVTYFNAEQTDLYDFATHSNCGLTVIVDGKTIIDNPAPSNNPSALLRDGSIYYGSERLDAGRHEIQIRVKRIASRSGFKVGVRSAYGRLAPVRAPSFAILDFIQMGVSNCASENTGVTPPIDVNVILNGLSAVYNGSPHPVTVTTVPAGVAVDVTYEGSPTHKAGRADPQQPEADWGFEPLV